MRGAKRKKGHGEFIIEANSPRGIFVGCKKRRIQGSLYYTKKDWRGRNIFRPPARKRKNRACKPKFNLEKRACCAGQPAWPEVAVLSEELMILVIERGAYSRLVKKFGRKRSTRVFLGGRRKRYSGGRKRIAGGMPQGMERNHDWLEPVKRCLQFILH